MPPRPRVFVIGLAIFFGIIEFLRTRRLTEEYSFIWLIAGFVFVLLAVESDALSYVSDLISTLPRWRDFWGRLM